jgi:DNA-binding MarR family transcriptional regulator
MTSVKDDVALDAPHIGQLLWAALQQARADGMAMVAADAAGIGPLSSAHARLLAQLPAGGARVTELAAAARITKQALGQLAAQLADRGYVEIVPDPDDRRAKLIRCTPRGERARQAVRAVAATLEDRWRARVGEARYAVFRDVLAELGHAAPDPSTGA